MFDTVIWATDGSETAAEGLPHAVELVGEGRGTLIVAHVRELIVGKGGGYPVYADEPDLRERLQEQVDELRSRGVDAKFEHRTCLSGRVGSTIAEIAKEASADVIVVGTHGHTRLGQLLIGSVTQQLLHLGTYPVLAIPTAGVAAAV
jgi:nucleotide-binding universal stress UspA family protein